MQQKPLTRADWLRHTLARYEAPLIRYAASILRDVEQARDVVQDSFLRLCAEDPARIGDHVAPWLFTVCRNRAFDVRRNQIRRAALNDEAANASGQQISAPSNLEKEEAMRRILEMCKTLPENQQEVLRLKFQNDLSYREISEITQLSVSNVGFLLHTALKTIRRRLAGADEPRTLRRVR